MKRAVVLRWIATMLLIDARKSQASFRGWFLTLAKATLTQISLKPRRYTLQCLATIVSLRESNRADQVADNPSRLFEQSTSESTTLQSPRSAPFNQAYPATMPVQAVKTVATSRVRTNHQHPSPNSLTNQTSRTVSAHSSYNVKDSTSTTATGPAPPAA